MPSPYTTVSDVLSRASVQLGLGTITSDPYASQDPNTQQLTEFLSTVGQELVNTHEWVHLRHEYSFNTVQGQTLYPLPADMTEMIAQSGWNRSTRLPLGGPLTSQQWEYLKARQVGIVYNVLFRQGPQELELFPSPSAGITIAFEYVSRYWVQSAANSTVVDSAGAPLGDKDTPSSAADLVLFDPLLLIRGVKLQFSQAKGFDTTVLRGEFDRRLSQVIGSNEGAPTLNLTNRAATGDRLLDTANIPLTNYGL